MRFGYFGAGTWGFSLASLLASKGHEVVLWGREYDQMKKMQQTRQHPKLLGYTAPENVTFTSDFSQTLTGAEVIIESVTSKGIRPLFQRIATGKIHPPHHPHF